MKKSSAVVQWGAVWGFAEATLGHLLHAIPVPGLAGTVMLPIALVCMRRAVADTGRAAAAMSVSAVAATVKLADLLLPGRGILMALRPAIAILVEGLIAAALFAALPAFLRRRA
jgi:hypothetical protein